MAEKQVLRARLIDHKMRGNIDEATFQRLYKRYGGDERALDRILEIPVKE